MRKQKTRPADMRAYLFWVELPKALGSVHEVWASTGARARQILEDRYLGQHARVRPYARGATDESLVEK